MRQVSRSIFTLVLILILGALVQGSIMSLLLLDAGLNDQILEQSSRIRGDVHRYAKLILADEREKAESVARQIDTDFLAIGRLNPRLSWYYRERIEFFEDWQALWPEWETLRNMGRAMEGRQMVEMKRGFALQSEKFLAGREVVGGFIEGLRDKKHLLFISMLGVAGLLIVVLAMLGWINFRSVRGQLEPQATTDPLTGLLNREGFFSRLDLKRGHSGGSLLMVDLDHFKKVNDTWGHQQGDTLLIGLARTFEALLRKQDLLCRFGGEEFLIWLPETPATEARLIAERLRQTLEGFPFPVIGRATVSIGGVEWPADRDWKDVYPLVDGALYRAKHGGRNRVVFEG